MPDDTISLVVVGASGFASYVAIFVLFTVGKVRTEILLELKDMEVRVIERIERKFNETNR